MLKLSKYLIGNLELICNEAIFPQCFKIQKFCQNFNGIVEENEYTFTIFGTEFGYLGYHSTQNDSKIAVKYRWIVLPPMEKNYLRSCWSIITVKVGYLNYDK